MAADDQIGELAAPKWKPTSRGKVVVESKEEIRTRLGRSTDRADAVVMAFWGQVDPVTLPKGAAAAGESETSEIPTFGW